MAQGGILMLEIPECIVIAQQLDSRCRGKRITTVVTLASPHKFAFFVGDPMGYEGLLNGKVMGTARAIGGMIEVTLSPNQTKLLFSDGVNLRYYAPGEVIPEKHQLYLRFDDGSALVCTVQMYGGIATFKSGENDSPYYKVAQEKPSPLNEAFDESYFLELINSVKGTTSVKGLLATEQSIPGLGNGVLQDILFNSKLHPKRKIDSLTPEEKHALFISIKTTLENMVHAGGRNSETDLMGDRCGYVTLLSNKTLNKPCPVCETLICKEAYMGGSVYFCPKCQAL